MSALNDTIDSAEGAVDSGNLLTLSRSSSTAVSRTKVRCRHVPGAVVSGRWPTPYVGATLCTIPWDAGIEPRTTASTTSNQEISIFPTMNCRTSSLSLGSRFVIRLVEAESAAPSEINLSLSELVQWCSSWHPTLRPRSRRLRHSRVRNYQSGSDGVRLRHGGFRPEQSRATQNTNRYGKY